MRTDGVYRAGRKDRAAVRRLAEECFGVVSLPNFVFSSRTVSASVHVYLFEGKVAGFAEMSYGNFCEVKLVATSPSYRRQGIGSALLAEVEKVAMLRNYAALYLEPGEGTRKWYSDRGYQKTLEDTIPELVKIL